jgi:hypothetical protein
MVRIGLIVLVAVVVALAAVLFLRPDAAATSSVDPDVSVECTAATGVGDASCLAWGDGILAEGSPSTTFEAEDVVRLRLDRELLGFGGSCTAEWFLGRYPDEVVWTEAVTCGGA